MNLIDEIKNDLHFLVKFQQEFQQNFLSKHPLIQSPNPKWLRGFLWYFGSLPHHRTMRFQVASCNCVAVARIDRCTPSGPVPWLMTTLHNFFTMPVIPEVVSTRWILLPPEKKSNINHEFRKGNILTVYFIEQKALGLHFARLVFWMATSTKFSLVSTCLVLGCFKHRNPSSTFSMQFDALLHGWKWHSRLSTEVRSPRSLSVSSTAFSREA